MGKPEAAFKAEIDSNWKRVQCHEEVKRIVESWTTTKTVKEIVDALLEAGVPAAPINNIAQVVNDPHIAGAREMFVEVDHPKAGIMTIAGTHIKLSETKAGVRTPAPLLGQHNEDVYSNLLGLTLGEIAELKKQGLI
jgi:formyl-CoA transferase